MPIEEVDRYADTITVFAALATDPDVRAALVEALCRCHDVPPGSRFGIRHFNSCPVADDGAGILAALRPPEAPDA